MKIKRYALSLALAACLPAGLANAQSTSRSSVGHIGDSSRTITDSVQAPTPQPDTRPEAFKDNYVDPSIPYDPVAIESHNHGGQAHSGHNHSGHNHSGHNHGGSAAYLGSDKICGTGACPPSSKPVRKRLQKLKFKRSEAVWLQYNHMLMFRSDADLPALAAQNPNPGVTPTIDNAGTEILAGGVTDAGLLNGFRFDAGMWLNKNHTFGIGGRIFGLFDTATSETFTSSGTPSLGIPFFNPGLVTNDAFVVALDTGAGGANTGSITVSNDFDVFNAEGFARFNLMQSGTSRWDFIGGYMFSRVDDSLSIASSSVNGITDAVTDGTVTETFDEFSTQNTFHGGQLGLISSITKKRWSLSSSYRVALGNVSQQITTSGSLVTTPPAGAGAPATSSNGVFAQPTNSGVLNRDLFTFIPQFDLNLGYQLSESLRFNVGYQFIFFSDVALAGSQIDPNVDIGNVGFGAVQPTAPASNDSLWLQGISLGGTFTF